MTLANYDKSYLADRYRKITGDDSDDSDDQLARLYLIRRMREITFSLQREDREGEYDWNKTMDILRKNVRQFSHI